MELDELCTEGALVFADEGFFAIYKVGFNARLDVKHESHGKQLSRVAKIGRAQVTFKSHTIFLFYIREEDLESSIQNVLRAKANPGWVRYHEARPKQTHLEEIVERISVPVTDLVGPSTFTGAPKDSPRAVVRRRRARKSPTNSQTSQPGTPSSSSSFEFSASPSASFTPHGTPSVYTSGSSSAPTTPYDTSSVEESPRQWISYSPRDFEAAARLPGTPPQGPYSAYQVQDFAPQLDVMMTRVNNTNVSLTPHPPKRRVIQPTSPFAPRSHLNARRQLYFEGVTGAVPSSVWLSSSPSTTEQVRAMELVTERSNLEDPCSRACDRHYYAKGTAGSDMHHVHYEFDQFNCNTSAGADIEYTTTSTIDIFSPPQIKAFDGPTSRPCISGQVEHGLQQSCPMVMDYFHN